MMNAVAGWMGLNKAKADTAAFGWCTVLYRMVLLQLQAVLRPVVAAALWAAERR